MPDSERVKQKSIITAHIKEIIEQETVRTQQDIIDKLIKRGFDINQSLVSRILKNIGIIKSPTGDGGVVYRLPWELSPPVVGEGLKSLVTRIAHNEATIIVSTSPGAASLVARIIDFEREHLDILGSIAGDDMIFIAPRSTKKIAEVCRRIEEHIWV